MQKQGTTIQPGLTRPPWPPWLVTLLAFLAPPGGAVLTVSNLGRMGALQADAVRGIALIVGAIYAIGLTTLLVIDQPKLTSHAAPSDGASLAITIGTAVASFVVQRPAYRSWRRDNRLVRQGSWMRAVVLVIFYTFLVYGGAVFLRLVVAALTGTAA